MKTTAKSEESKPRRLSDHREYAEAQATLERLNDAKTQLSAGFDALTLRMNRSSKTKSYANMQPAAFARAIGDEEMAGFAAQASADGRVSENLSARMRSGVKILFDDTEGDLDLVTQFDDSRRARAVLELAISLQKREVQRRKTAAIKEICQEVRSDRERIARTVANRFLELGQALREENAFSASLGLQDEGIQADISPLPFPVELPWEQLLLPWIAEALGISEAEARLKAGFESLDLERRRKELDRAASGRG